MENGIPLINDLKEDGSKFIQFYIGNVPYLRFAPGEGPYYHGLLLKNSLKNEFGLEFKTFYDNGLEMDIPVAKDKNLKYNLVGAGKAKILSKNETLYYQDSVSYGISTNLRHLEEIFESQKVEIREENLSYIVKKLSNGDNPIGERNMRDRNIDNDIPF